MLTVAYCRVSTEEQAAEGFSIDGQAEKLRAYAELHDLGAATVVADPGWSGKNLERPGLQQLLAMVEAGHVRNVLTWRLDRLSRNLGDLILLAGRRKLLELHYADRISAELFAEEEQALTRQIEAVRAEASGKREEDQQLDELAARFEQVAATLRDLDVRPGLGGGDGRRAEGPRRGARATSGRLLRSPGGDRPRSASAQRDPR